MLLLTNYYLAQLLIQRKVVETVYVHSAKSARRKSSMLNNNKALPFVTNAKHRGNTLDVCDTNNDIAAERGITIG